MRYNYPYLQDSTFLKYFDTQHLKEQFAKVTVLTLEEKPIQAIEGRVISGSLNIDGSSSIRRTCNLTMIADEFENNLTKVNNLISINKKVELELGFINNTPYYKEYDMIWFPLGVYVIITPNISFDSSSGVTISLQLKDKMCLLNGECGGTLPAAVTFSEYDTIDENGAYVTLHPTIYQIIEECVNHWGGEQLSKIVISDVDTRIKQVMKWVGSAPLYVTEQEKNGQIQYQPTTDITEAEAIGTYKTYSYGDDVGFIYTDFTYPGELVGDAGNSVCDILDKIKNTLGNYEYFYDLNGNFVFQEIKNYLNTSHATVELEKLTKEDYVVDMSLGKAVYVFDDSSIITAYTNAPQYNMIKNDFMIWGKRENADGITVECRYHLAIDRKPDIDDTYKVFKYEDPDDGLTKAKCPIMFDSKDEFPKVGQAEVFYYARDTETVYKWDVDDDGSYNYIAVALGLMDYKPADWRTALYLQGTCAEPFGKDSNYYYTELKNEWPKIYDIFYDNGDGTYGKFYDSTLAHPEDIDFFLDFIDSGAAISELNISNIGRRSKVVVDDDVNCVFESEVPDFILLDNSVSDEQLAEERAECDARGQTYMQVSTNIFSKLATGGSQNSGYEYIRQLLHQYTSYNESINITTLPIYYLEPNTRITVRNTQSGIYGDYMITNMSIPLDISSTMTISCTRALERV